MDLKYIEPNKIRQPKYLFRPVRKHSVEYQEMLDSIRDHGLWQPILVRPLRNGQYEVVEGNWRFTCCKQLRFETVPCVIRDLTDDEVLLAQLQANGIRPETTPVEFADRLEQIMRRQPGMTVPKLARMICKSPHWLRRILRLTNLKSTYSQMTRRGEIPLESAIALARLPQALQDAFIQQAAVLPVREFVKLANAEVKRYREASKNGYIDGLRINREQPVPYLRKVPEIRAEFTKPAAAGPVLLKMDAQSPFDGWKACLAWILHMDPESLEEQEQMIVARRDQQQRAEERRKLERQKLRELRKAGNDTLIMAPENET
jgi:ParB/RepB/Spo0J family partition protein